TALLAYSNEILDAIKRTDDVNNLAKRAKTLLQAGRAREAESLLQDATKQYPDEEIFLPLLKRAREAVAQEDTARDQDTVRTPREVVGANRQQVPVVPQEKHRVPPPPVEPGRKGREQRSGQVLRAAIWLAVVIAIGLVGWLLFSGGDKTN